MTNCQHVIEYGACTECGWKLKVLNIYSPVRVGVALVESFKKKVGEDVAIKVITHTHPGLAEVGFDLSPSDKIRMHHELVNDVIEMKGERYAMKRDKPSLGVYPQVRGGILGQLRRVLKGNR